MVEYGESWDTTGIFSMVLRGITRVYYLMGLEWGHSDIYIYSDDTTGNNENVHGIWVFHVIFCVIQHAADPQGKRVKHRETLHPSHGRGSQPSLQYLGKRLTQHFGSLEIQ